MENMILSRVSPNENLIAVEDTLSDDRSFIQANTVPATLDDMRKNHVIPVFVKDNEPTISQVEFIDTLVDATSQAYYGEQILKPSIRLSHSIKGRIPNAKDKPANQLLEWEKTIYYERMMFVVEIPSITEDIDGNKVTLTIGGVKAYSQDNLYNRKGADEHFKVFAGFKNKVCTNLSVWSDGFASDIKVKTPEQLWNAIHNLLVSYNPVDQIQRMRSLTNYGLTESQFATLIGRCRMYPFLSGSQKEGIDPILFGDAQIGTVCRDYFKDNSFSKASDGSISLWRLYNLFTGANKSTYIDQFLDRSVNASKIAESIRKGLDNRGSCWYLN